MTYWREMVAAIFDSKTSGYGCCIGRRVVGGRRGDKGTDRLEKVGSYGFRLSEREI